MATTDTRHRTTLGNRFRFLVRVLGLTGVVVAAVGGVMLATADTDPAWLSAFTVDGLLGWSRSVLDGGKGEFARTAGFVLAGGLAVAVVAVVVEAVGGLFLVTGRRTFAGANATVQIVLAVVLFVGVNVLSFLHYRRDDLTRDGRFTIPPAVAAELRTLRPDRPTRIVVLQKHKTFGLLEKADPDSYDTAAERKMVEKVRDLVDQFRELGPQFKVSVLDVKAEGYDAQLAAATADAPGLKDAVAAAPEGSIFFAAGGKVQRLGFNEFYQLDKAASKAANGGKGNLVLLPQGVEAFARRVLAVQEKRPKVALAVIHEVLTTEATEDEEQTFTAVGLKKALGDFGFDVVDVVLKKGWEAGEPQAAAYSLAESKLERLEAELATADEQLVEARRELAGLTEVQKQIDAVKGKPFSERGVLYRKLFGRPLPEEQEARVLASLSRQLERTRAEVPDLEKERRAADDKVREVSREERALQDRRLTDVKAKFGKLLADVDLLILPRITVVNTTTGFIVSPSLHKLSKEQAEVVKDFMKAGKPVLACLGPITNRRGVDAEAVDDFERLLADRGVELGRQTILFDGETKALAGRRAGNQFGGGRPAEIPPLVFDDAADGEVKLRANPVGEALRVTARSVDQKLDLRLRGLRPVYLAPGWKGNVPFAAEFALTAPDSWNEERPILETRPIAGAPGVEAVTYIPKYEATPLEDPKHGTRDEERRGPFPVGVAVESKLPAYWYDGVSPARAAAMAVAGTTLGTAAAGVDVLADAGRLEGPTSRLVVFGQGGLFTGPELKPAQQRLLLHSANWLLGRADRLPRGDVQPWSFPRADLSDRAYTLWWWGAFVGLPVLAAYVGLIVLMVRNVR